MTCSRPPEPVLVIGPTLTVNEYLKWLLEDSIPRSLVYPGAWTVERLILEVRFFQSPELLR